MNAEDTKYTRVEYERRFLVREDANWRDRIDPGTRVLDDKYLRDTRLRLRIVTDTESGHRIVKLTKKADSTSPYFRTVSRILLSPAEYTVLDAVDGDRLTKTRYHCTHLGRTYAIDRFDGELDGLVLCEVEAADLDDLMKAEPPDFAYREVTEDAFFDGANLCRIGREELLAKLASFRAS
jgi:CYTH domain-containing protein